MTPAQSAYKQFGSDFGKDLLYEWKDAGATTQERWERIAQAAIDAFFQQPVHDVMEYYDEDDEDETENDDGQESIRHPGQ